MKIAPTLQFSHEWQQARILTPPGVCLRVRRASRENTPGECGRFGLTIPNKVFPSGHETSVVGTGATLLEKLRTIHSDTRVDITGPTFPTRVVLLRAKVTLSGCIFVLEGTCVPRGGSTHAQNLRKIRTHVAGSTCGLGMSRRVKSFPP